MIFLTNDYVNLQEEDIPIHRQTPVTKGDGNCLIYCFLNDLEENVLFDLGKKIKVHHLKT